ncbi:Plasmodium vivax Vir protein, putative [Plasmodium ovale]|uniref:Plasmodium vivax Vir protein, putative n=1 Tax=Plasmodium ovale TaxID=36330 RepID=A0A1C3KHE3_PLAOA|nr:Plasmodium vivax Vir protein, putative [Plasmodium ovale]
MEYRVDILKKTLQSFVHDIYWNNPVTSCSKCSLCDDVSTDMKNELWFKFLCYPLVKNLELSATLNRDNNEDVRVKRCKSLMYWIYDRVERIYVGGSFKNKKDIITQLNAVWKNFYENTTGMDKSYKCKVPENPEFQNLKDAKKRKIIFDTCWNYSELKRILNYPAYENCHIYYDYLKDNLSKYKEISGVCSEGDYIMINCSRFCTNADPDNIFNSSQCRTIEISPEKDDYMKKSECDDLKKPDPEVKYLTTEIKIPEFTFSDKRAIILTLFSSWGMFLTLLFLYKMTPFRSWIRNKLEKKKIIRDSFNDQSDNELLDADYESVDRDMLNTGYNITYNSD